MKKCNNATLGDDKRRLCLRLSVFVCKRGSKRIISFHFTKIIHFNFFFVRSFLSRISSSYKQLIYVKVLLPFLCVCCLLLARESIVVNRYWIKIKAGHLRFAQHQCKMLYIHVRSVVTWLCCWWVFLSL